MLALDMRLKCNFLFIIFEGHDIYSGQKIAMPFILKDLLPSGGESETLQLNMRSKIVLFACVAVQVCRSEFLLRLKRKAAK